MGVVWAQLDAPKRLPARPRCGRDAPMMRLSHADLRRAGYTLFGRDQYFVNWCGHGQEFITVPDTAGMWWLVPIIGEAS